jgi:hypothetical protein
LREQTQQAAGFPIAEYDRLPMAAAAGWIARIITVLRTPAGTNPRFPKVIPRRIFRLSALMVWPGLQPTAQQLVESIVAGELNGQVSAES